MINVHGESYHIKVGGKGHKSEGKRPYFLWVDNQLVEVLVEPLVECSRPRKVKYRRTWAASPSGPRPRNPAT